MEVSLPGFASLFFLGQLGSGMHQCRSPLLPRGPPQYPPGLAPVLRMIPLPHLSPQLLRGQQQTPALTSGPCSSSSLRCGAKRLTGTTPSVSAPQRSTMRCSGTGQGRVLCWAEQSWHRWLSPHAPLFPTPPALPWPHSSSTGAQVVDRARKGLFLVFSGVCHPPRAFP